MQPFAGRAKLVSPAITNGAAPMGTAWLDSFLSACSGCTIDVIAIQYVYNILLCVTASIDDTSLYQASMMLRTFLGAPV